MARNAEIKFSVNLDDNNFPTEINWEATDSGTEGIQKTEVMLISLWDSKNRNTLSIDLWTNKMLVDDMNLHFYQTFMKMADTYQASTQNEDLSNEIRKFAFEFGDKLNLLSKDEN